MSLTVTIPTLETPRLLLRAPQTGDFDAYAQALAGDRAAFTQGPYDRTEAWLDWCEAVAGWVLHGMGPWTMVARGQDGALGWAGLSCHPHCPEPELVWMLTEAAEGHGYAQEASGAVLHHAFGNLGLATLVSYIAPGNARAEALAARLGARREPGTPAPLRTIAYRYPAPEARP